MSALESKMSSFDSEDGDMSFALKSALIDSWRIKVGSRGENFAVFCVQVKTVSGLSWEIEKRYTQFRHLRRDLQRANEETKEMPFPEKRVLFNLSETNLSYRRKILSDFLSNLIEKDREGEELLAFLQVVNNVSLLKARKPSSSFKSLVRAGSMSEIYGDLAPNITDFSTIRIIGQGSFGKVFLVRPKDADANSGEVYAMKLLQKSEVIRRHQVEHTMTERSIMSSVSHPFIMALKFAFQTPENLYMITEYCPGGELYFHLKRRKVFSVNMMQFYTAQIAMALEHLHHKKIIFRDLKPENILLDRDGNCKLTDFGLSKLMTAEDEERLAIARRSGSTASSLTTTSSAGGDADEESQSQSQPTEAEAEAEKKQRHISFTFCGTPEYLSPEMLLHRMRGSGYSFEVDWWSLGIVSFEMVVGYVPFFDRDFNRMCEKILHRPLRFPSKCNIPEDAQKFIKGLLQRDPRRRLCSSHHKAGELKTIPFFAKSIDFDYLERGLIVPPFIPHVKSKGPQDASNFENEAALRKISNLSYQTNNTNVGQTSPRSTDNATNSLLTPDGTTSESTTDSSGIDQSVFANFEFPSNPHKRGEEGAL